MSLIIAIKFKTQLLAISDSLAISSEHNKNTIINVGNKFSYKSLIVQLNDYRLNAKPSEWLNDFYDEWIGNFLSI